MFPKCARGCEEVLSHDGAPHLPYCLVDCSAPAVPQSQQQGLVNTTAHFTPGTRLQVTFAIAPMLDCFNHSSAHTAEVGYDWLREAFSVASCREYLPGQEVCISYGELSNDACLQRYGFVEENNPYDSYVIGDLGARLLEGPLAEQATQPEELRRQVLQAGALLHQVPASAAGLPAEVVQCVQQLSTSTLTGGGSSSSKGSGSTSPKDLAATALAAACRQEMQALGTSLEEDRAELEQVQALLEQEALAAVPALPRSTGGDPQHLGNAGEPGGLGSEQWDKDGTQEQQLWQQEAEARGLSSSERAHQDQEGTGGAGEDGAPLSRTGTEVKQLAPQPAMGHAHQELGQGTSDAEPQQLAYTEGSSSVSTPTTTGTVQSNDSSGTGQEKGTVDVDRMRQLTWLQYRIEKKKVLQSCIQAIA